MIGDIYAVSLQCRHGDPTRASVESSSTEGTNRALWYEYIEILKLPHPKDPTREVWAVQVNLVHTKDLGGK